MKYLPMIIAIVVSIFPAQGIVAQDELVDNGGFEYENYDYEQQEYTELEIMELPMVVEDIIARDYNDLFIYRIYISKDNSYKVVLRGKDNFAKIVFASANGEWITPNDRT